MEQEPIGFNHALTGLNNVVLDLDSPPQKKIKAEIASPPHKKMKSETPTIKKEPSASHVPLPALRGVIDVLSDDDECPGAPSSAARANHAEPEAEAVFSLLVSSHVLLYRAQRITNKMHTIFVFGKLINYYQEVCNEMFAPSVLCGLDKHAAPPTPPTVHSPPCSPTGPPNPNFPEQEGDEMDVEEHMDIENQANLFGFDDNRGD